MPYLVGLLLALGVGLFALLAGFDRDRAFYPTLVIVVAHYYGLFAVMGGSMTALGLESLAIAGFLILAVLGFKGTPWFIVAGLAGHGIFDFFHGGIIANPGVPSYWPMFCLSFDVTAAVWLAVLLVRRGPARQAA